MLEFHPERRRMQRREVQEPVTVKYWDHGPREITAMVRDASLDGIFLESDREIPAQSSLELVFLFPATLRSPGMRFVCHCRPVRAEQDPEQGKFGLGLSILRSHSERIGAAESEAAGADIPGLVLADS